MEMNKLLKTKQNETIFIVDRKKKRKIKIKKMKNNIFVP
jgi:hypothetical protein